MFGEAAPQIALDARVAQLISALSTQQSFVCTDHLQARRRYRASRQQLAWPCEMVGEAVDLLIEEPGVPRLRLFRPLESRPRQSLQTLIYLHGGGWTVGDLSVYEPLCRKLANLLPANIIWVEYRLAPEHPFPAPLEDTLTAISWIFRHARKLAIDDTRIGLAGDSAGANLAAVAALVNRGESLRELAQGYLLTRSTYRWYLDNYLDGADPLHWRLSPLRSTDFQGLPPTVILHAGYDPLHDEAIDYADKLKHAGVKVREISYPEMFHGFITMGAVLPQAISALLEIRLALAALRAS